MIGSITSVPISMKMWVAGAAAVCHIVRDGGTRYGKFEIKSPR